MGLLIPDDKGSLGKPLKRIRHFENLWISFWHLLQECSKRKHMFPLQYQGAQLSTRVHDAPVCTCPSGPLITKCTPVAASSLPRRSVSTFRVRAFVTTCIAWCCQPLVDDQRRKQQAISRPEAATNHPAIHRQELILHVQRSEG